MSKYPKGGCYGLCYAAKIAKLYNYDFSKSVSRKINYGNNKQLKLFKNVFTGWSPYILKIVKRHKLKWFRIGTMGDPCHNWPLTVELCEWLGIFKIPVIITKHWITLPDDMLPIIRKTNTVVNTSISALDSKQEIKNRINQFERLKEFGIRSILRIVSCNFGNTNNGKNLNKIQNTLLNNKPIIDNPLRIPPNDKRVINGDIIIKRVKDINSFSYISVLNNNTYIGKCIGCPDQCGVL
jgi:hypothetical protein